MASERKVARALARQALAQLPERGRGILGVAFNRLYRLFGGRHGDEFAAWAPTLGLTPHEVCLLNCTYELSHAGDVASRSFQGWMRALHRPFGCTAGVRWVEGLGMVHVRSMDWPLSEVGRATRLFEFDAGSHTFLSVGMPGFVGVLSGMVPGAYSVTMNWAPPSETPGFELGPAFLLREVLETCRTWASAVRALKETKLSSPVFFVVCGAEKGQACVIERTRAEAALRHPGEDGVLVQANHHLAPKFRDRNAPIITEDPEDGDVMSQSTSRHAVLEERLSALTAAVRLSEVRQVLRRSPVQNEESHQQMVFRPATGEVAVWGLQ